MPAIASDMREVVIDPPDRTFDERATVEVGDRVLELAYLGRAHTDRRHLITVPDANVLFAGDLLEEGAPPSFGDSYPLEWPATVERMLPLVDRRGRAGARQGRRPVLRRGRSSRTSARSPRSRSGSTRASSIIEAAIAEAPFGPRARDAFERALPSSEASCSTRSGPSLRPSVR